MENTPEAPVAPEAKSVATPNTNNDGGARHARLYKRSISRHEKILRQ